MELLKLFAFFEESGNAYQCESCMNAFTLGAQLSLNPLE